MRRTRSLHRTAAAAIAATVLINLAAPADAASGHPWKNLAGSNRCMDADNSNGLNDGSTVNIWGCVAGKSNQQWVPVYRGTDSNGASMYQFEVLGRTSKCLDVNESGGGSVASRRVQIWTCGSSGKLNQEFGLYTHPDGTTCLVNEWSNEPLNAPQGVGDGAPVYTTGPGGYCDGAPRKEWSSS